MVRPQGLYKCFGREAKPPTSARNQSLSCPVCNLVTVLSELSQLLCLLCITYLNENSHHHMPLHLNHHNTVILQNEDYSLLEFHSLWGCRQAETILNNILHLQGIMHYQNDSNFNFNTQWTQQKNHSCPTPCSRVLPEKLTVSQLVKEFCAFYGSWMFVTVFNSLPHLPVLNHINLAEDLPFYIFMIYINPEICALLGYYMVLCSNCLPNYAT
jgi:hypothetical protein